MIDPLVDRDCLLLDGFCECRSISDCKYLTQPQGKEVYPDCRKPDGCVFCGGVCPYKPTVGGYCPYTTAKSLDG